MGTAKRERQKANRQQRLEQLAKEQQRQKKKSVAIRLVLIVVVFVAGAYLISRAVSGGGSKGSAATSTTEAVTTSSYPTATTGVPPSTVPGATLTGDTPCPKTDGSSPRTITFAKAPPTCIDAAKTYTAKVTTNKGDLTIALDAKKAPNTVNNFVVLARYHFFDGTLCHRIIPQFAVQCGDPTASGSGGPGYSFNDELPKQGEYKVGSVAMANSGANTNGSQFFIVTGASGAALQPNYSLFGQVTDGADTTLTALDKAGNPDPNANGTPPLEQVVIQSVTITES